MINLYSTVFVAKIERGGVYNTKSTLKMFKKQ